MMTSVLQLVSPDCLSASLMDFGLSVQTARLRQKHSHRQVGLARRCTDEEHAGICGVARGILCAERPRSQLKWPRSQFKRSRSQLKRRRSQLKRPRSQLKRPRSQLKRAAVMLSRSRRTRARGFLRAITVTIPTPDHGRPARSLARWLAIVLDCCCRWSWYDAGVVLWKRWDPK